MYEKVITFIDKLYWGNDDKINRQMEANRYSIKTLSNVVAEVNEELFLVTTVFLYQISNNIARVFPLL